MRTGNVGELDTTYCSWKPDQSALRKNLKQGNPWSLSVCGSVREPSIVDLPDCFSPTKPTTSPRLICIFTAFTARLAKLSNVTMTSWRVATTSVEGSDCASGRPGVFMTRLLIFQMEKDN